MSVYISVDRGFKPRSRKRRLYAINQSINLYLLKFAIKWQ